MTFAEVVAEVQDRLNLTSSESTTRIGKRVNSRYKRVTSALGINTSRRGTATVATVAATATVSLTMEKVEIVYVSTTGARRVLEERTYDELKAMQINENASGYPTAYAVMNQGATTVTLLLYPTPSGIETISADGTLNASTLSGTDVPALPLDFHDVLVVGTMADELLKMEKADEAGATKAEYEQRMNELRYFIAKSAYLLIHQGPNPRRAGRIRVV